MQSAVADVVIEIVGSKFTVMEILPVLLHPFASMPVKEKISVVVGVAMTGEPLVEFNEDDAFQT